MAGTKKKNILSVLGALLVIFMFFLTGNTATAASPETGEIQTGAEDIREEQETGLQQETETETEDSITKISATIVSITGNQLTYTKLADLTGTNEKETEEPVKEAAEEPVSEAGEEPVSEAGEPGKRPSGENSGMPQRTRGGDTSGESGENSGMPQRTRGGDASGESGENSGMPQRTRGGDASGEMSQRRQNGRSGKNQTVTVYIPVSAPVYTDTGKQMTFSILQAGDTITIQTESNDSGEEIITAIWLTDTE